MLYTWTGTRHHTEGRGMILRYSGCLSAASVAPILFSSHHALEDECYGCFVPDFCRRLLRRFLFHRLGSQAVCIFFLLFLLVYLFICCFLPFLAPSIRHPRFVFNDPTVIYLFTKLITINPLHYFVRVFSIIYRICYFIISFSRLRLFTLIYSCLWDLNLN